jgi:hypothetical protein
MAGKQDTWTRRVDGKPETYVEVRTNTRSYGVVGPGRVTWEEGEEVISIEARPKGQAVGGT